MMIYLNQFGVFFISQDIWATFYLLAINMIEVLEGKIKLNLCAIAKLQWLVLGLTEFNVALVCGDLKNDEMLRKDCKWCH
jgi:hypothetical protein